MPSQSSAVVCAHSNCSGLSIFLTEGMNERKLSQVVSGDVCNGQALNRLPREVVDSPSVEVFKRCVGVSLRHILVGILAGLGLRVSK